MNKQTQLFSVILTVGSLLLLSGCANYKAISLPHLTTHPNKNENSKSNNVTLEHKIFNKIDCTMYLGRKNLLKKNYQPVQLTLTNNTDRTYIYSAANLNLPTVPAEVVAKEVKFSKACRVAGFTAIGSALLIPIIPLALVSIDLVIPGAGVAALCCLGSSAGFFATGIRDGVKTGKENKKLIADFAAKSFPQEGVLNPYETINGIVFVPKKSFNTDFTFTLNDANNDKVVVLNSTSDNINVK